MSPSEIGRLVRHLQHDQSFRARVLVDPLRAFQAAGYSLDDDQATTLHGFVRRMSEGASASGRHGRPWGWALPNGPEHVVKFETKVKAPDANGNHSAKYTQWMSDFADYVQTINQNGERYRGMVLMQSHADFRKFRWSISWIRDETLPLFMNAIASYLHQTGKDPSPEIDPAQNTQNADDVIKKIEKWDIMDEWDSHKFVQLPNLFAYQEEWKLNLSDPYFPQSANDDTKYQLFVNDQKGKILAMAQFPSPSAPFLVGAVIEQNLDTPTRFHVLKAFQAPTRAKAAQQLALVLASGPVQTWMTAHPNVPNPGKDEWYFIYRNPFAEKNP